MKALAQIFVHTYIVAVKMSIVAKIWYVTGWVMSLSIISFWYNCLKLILYPKIILWQCLPPIYD